MVKAEELPRVLGPICFGGGAGTRDAPPAGSTYGFFTGAYSNDLIYLESTTSPVYSDVRVVDYGGPATPLNPYSPEFGSVLRSVRETVETTQTGYKLQIFVDATGDLFPSNMPTSSDSAFGIGLNLPPQIGGPDSLDWQPGDGIDSAEILFLDASGSVVLDFDIVNSQTALWFPGNPNWNGRFGARISGLRGRDVQQIRMTINAVPEQSSLVAGVIGSALLARRWRYRGEKSTRGSAPAAPC